MIRIRCKVQSHQRRKLSLAQLCTCGLFSHGVQAPVPGKVQGGRGGGRHHSGAHQARRGARHHQILRVGKGRAEPGDADAGLHPRLLHELRQRRGPGGLHGPREALCLRRHLHGRA